MFTRRHYCHSSCYVMLKDTLTQMARSGTIPHSLKRHTRKIAYVHTYSRIHTQTHTFSKAHDSPNVERCKGEHSSRGLREQCVGFTMGIIRDPLH